MPETPDWSAPPQAVISVAGPLLFTPGPSGSSFADFGLAVAGQRVVIVGLDLTVYLPGVVTNPLTGWVSLILIDGLSGNLLLAAAISPGAPSDEKRPPFGSLRGTLGSNVQGTAYAEPGVGRQQVVAALSYYYEAG